MCLTIFIPYQISDVTKIALATYILILIIAPAKLLKLFHIDFFACLNSFPSTFLLLLPDKKLTSKKSI